MGIDAGNTSIGQKYDQKRATVDQQVGKQQETTEAAKQQAIAENTNAWDEVNKVDSDTLGGVISETAGDFIGAMGATFEAGNAVIMDAISDAFTEAYDNVADTAYDVGEAVEKGVNTAGNIAAGVAGVTENTVNNGIQMAKGFIDSAIGWAKGIAEDLTSGNDVAFDEAIAERHPEEAEEA